jgi:thymidine kinase
MLTEPAFGIQKGGWIEVICGCMFSGKTEELIRRINRAKIANQKILIVKPAIEARYHPNQVVSHNTNTLDAVPVNSSKEILELAKNVNVVGIDEVQFFDKEIVSTCVNLANQGKRVIAVGLDMDYQGNPFGEIGNLMAVAEFVTKLHAICAVSGELASFSFRKTASKENILLGGKEEYEPRSRRFFY